MNSTHAAWINGAITVGLALVGAVGGLSGLPSWAYTAVAIAGFALNTVAHAALPDAPKSAPKGN